MNIVYRQEKKFLINIEESMAKSHMLEKVMIPDPNNTANGYMVRSLYFDTPDDQDYFDKINGIEIRRKIRLRCYDPGADYAVLEMKQKQGVQQRKRSLRLTKRESVALIHGDYSVLLDHPDDFAGECYGLMKYSCYMPKVIIEFGRKAYIAKENKIRVTFDSGLKASESNMDLFSDDLLLNPVMDNFSVILEVKYNGFLLSYIQQMLNSINKSETAVSKYYLSRHSSYDTHL